jgi:hypothetical protein
MNTRRLSIGILCSWLAVASTTSFTGCDEVESVKEYLVEISVAGGEIIKEKASVLATAAAQAYKRLFPEVVDGVTVDRSNPLKGTREGEILAVQNKYFEDGKLVLEFIVKIKDPPMLRETEDSNWELDYEALPPEFQSRFQKE